MQYREIPLSWSCSRPNTREFGKLRIRRFTKANYKVREFGNTRIRGSSCIAVHISPIYLLQGITWFDTYLLIWLILECCLRNLPQSVVTIVVLSTQLAFSRKSYFFVTSSMQDSFPFPPKRRSSFLKVLEILGLVRPYLKSWIFESGRYIRNRISLRNDVTFCQNYFSKPYFSHNRRKFLLEFWPLERKFATLQSRYTVQ